MAADVADMLMVSSLLSIYAVCPNEGRDAMLGLLRRGVVDRSCIALPLWEQTGAI